MSTFKGKHIRSVLLALGLILVSSSALADLGPPIEVKLISELKPAVAGEVYEGRLSITSFAPVSLGNFRIAGKSWQPVQVQALEVESAKGETHEISFSAVPTDPDQPLVIEFDVEGHAFRKTLDLSPRNIERAFRPGPTRAAPVQLRPPYTPRPSPETEVSPADQPDRSKAGVIRVSGRFVYDRGDGITEGARHMRVVIYDEDYGADADDFLNSGYTDEFGYFDFYVDTTNDSPTDTPDVMAVFQTTNLKVDILNPTTTGLYLFDSITYLDYTGTHLDFGTVEPIDEDDRNAVYLFNTASRAYYWCLDASGYDMPPVDIHWPEGDESAWFMPGTNDIFISTEHEWNDGTLGHEYGHFFEDTFSTIEPFTYCNSGGWCDGPDGCSHCIWCEESGRVAWMEGWAQFFSAAFTLAYEDYFDVPARFPRDFDRLQECGEWGFHDPERSEGFLAALLQDIWDDNFDNDPLYPDWQDMAGLGLDEILITIEQDNPESPTTFLDSFIARYPVYSEGIWQTAANNGYNPDYAPPGVVTLLTSTSHSTSGDSADPTIRFTWAAAPDDVSGIGGYGLYISSSPGLPDAVADIGGVTEYTTEPLAPGTWWFNIRAMDRAGNWNASYVTCGPFTIRAPGGSDVTWYQSPNWPYPLVPSDVASNSTGSCPMPSFLPGNADATYWNVWGQNQGADACESSFHVGLHLDGESLAGLTYGATSSGGQYASVNRGALEVRGGRHTLSVVHDDLEVLAESDETNNYWGYQFMWTGLPIAVDTVYERPAPPEGLGGWDELVGYVGIYFNCDGLSFSSTSYWHAVTAVAVDNQEDYDLRLHTRSLGAEDGFGSSLAYSRLHEGWLDAVIINTNTTGAGNYDVSVVNEHYGAGNYKAQLVDETAHDIGDSVTYTLSTDHYLQMFEFYVGNSDTGYVSINLSADYADGPLKLLYLDRDFEYGTIPHADENASLDESGQARLDLHIQETGYCCAVVYRNPHAGNAPRDFTLEIQTTPPDPQAYLASGWYAPLVPRPAADGTFGSVDVPDTLYGNVASTYFNYATYNNSPSPANGLQGRISVDGATVFTLTWPSFLPFYTGTVNSSLARTVRGGRHTVDLTLDHTQVYEELDESNNSYAEQFVWGPESLAPGTTHTRSAPPSPMAGWENVAAGNALYYNCDGLRIHQSGFWHALAVLPYNATDRKVLRLHLPVAGAKGGFKSNEAWSNWPAGESDFVLVNYNLAPNTPVDVGVLDFYAGSSYKAHSVMISFLDTDPESTYGPFSLATGEILNLHEIRITEPGPVFFRLKNTTGSIDWGLSLYGSDVVYASKSGALQDGSSWTGGPGEEETISLNVTETGYYCLAVWKVGSSDLNLGGSYTLEAFDANSAVGEEYGVPIATRFGSIHPNPFNPSTTLSFDLAQSGPVFLEIFDLQGRLVRTLLSETRAAGTHRVRWDGLDDDGRQAASNVYLARFRAAQVSESRKLVLLK